MKKALLCLLAAALPLLSQAVRVDPQSVMKTAGNVGPGAYPQLLAVPGPHVAVCNAPANGVPCTNYAATYSDATAGTTCPSNAQLTIASSNTCVGFGDNKGNFGFWILPGSYSYTITFAGQSFGPYPLTVTASAFTPPVPWTVPAGGTGTVNPGTGILLGNNANPFTTLATGQQTQFVRSKPNVLTPTPEYASLPSLNINDYNFPAQTPGGTLTASTPATVTLSPQPLGVKGTDGHHYLYVSGGTGTAEAVLITGGTASGTGAGSGTIQFTPVNSHSGAWQIGPSSSGAQEAVLVSQSGQRGAITAPCGSYSLYAPVYIDISGNLAVNFGGCGYGYFNLANGTTFNNLATTPAFQIVGGSLTTGCEAETFLHDFTIHGSATSGTGISASNACQLRIEHIFQVESALFGFSCGPNCYTVTVDHSFFYSNGLSGVSFSGVPHSTSFNDVATQNNCRQSAGVACNGFSVDGGFRVSVKNSSFALDGVLPIGGFPSSGDEVSITNSTAVTIDSNYVEQPLTNAFRIDNVQGFNFTGNYAQQGGVLVTSTSLHGAIGAGNQIVSGNNPVVVTGAVSNGGLCKITLTAAPTVPVTIGSFADIESVGGATTCNGKSSVQSVQSTTQFTIGLAFSGAYTSGGTFEHVAGISIAGSSGYSDIHYTGGSDLSDSTLLIVGGDLYPGPGPDIASAGTIAPTNTSQTITGSAAIATMTPPSGFGGQFCTPNTTGTWTTTTGGNFAAAYSAVANTLKCWQWKPAASKWY